MPSSSNYVRDIQQEEKTAKARGEVGGHDAPNAERKRARRKALKLGLVHKGQDWDHIKMLSQGGSNSVANGRARSPHMNRGFPRRSDGSAKNNDGPVAK